MYFVSFLCCQLFWTQGCPRGMCTNGTQVPCEVPSLTNPTTRKGWPHHRGLQPLLFLNSDVGSFTSHKKKSVKVLWDGTYDCRPYPKTRKPNHLQISLQRQHFLLSYLKTLSFGPAGVWTATSPSTDRRSPNWANHAAVCITQPKFLSLFFRYIKGKIILLITYKKYRTSRSAVQYLGAYNHKFLSIS